MEESFAVWRGAFCRQQRFAFAVFIYGLRLRFAFTVCSCIFRFHFFSPFLFVKLNKKYNSNTFLEIPNTTANFSIFIVSGANK